MKNKYIKTFLFIILVSFLICYQLFVRDFFISKLSREEESKTYQGIISIWDNPTRTVIGSEYGFLNNMISNFMSDKTLIQMEVRKLNFEDSYKLANEKAMGKNPPDIISKYVENKIISTDNIIYNKEFVQNIKTLYEVNTISLEEERCIFPIYGSYNVIIINKTELDRLGIKLPSKNWKYNDFLELMEEIKKKDKSKIPFDMVVNENNYSYMNFILENGYENINYDYLTKLKKELKGYNALSINKTEDNVKYDLYNSNTLIFAGNLSDVNYLLRTKDKENAFEFEIYSYPYNINKVDFISEVKSYYLLNTKDEKKKEVLYSFIDYIYSNEGENILNIQGKVPLFKTNYSKKDLKYPHLEEFVNNQNYYSIEDESFIFKKKDIYKNIKTILK